MAGEARTTSFNVSTATVMIGPTADLYELNPDQHSIGLVKNIVVTSEVQELPLYQGVRQTKVYSVPTQTDLRVAMEVYEYTGKNLTYALGLDGSTLTGQVFYPLAANVTGPTEAVTANSATNPNIPVNSWVILQENKSDKVHVGLVDASTYTSPTLTLSLTTATQVPAGVSFTAANGRVAKANVVNIGSKDPMPFFSAKIVGVLPEDNRPITILFPKIKIIRGFSVSFTSDNYSNLPFEFDPYELTPSDTFYNDFKDSGGMARLFTAD